jgi:Protein of unknown function (DUF3489)
MHSNSAETANNPAAALAEQPKLPQKPQVAPHRANVAPSELRLRHKAAPGKKATKAAKSHKMKTPGAQRDSKTAKVLDLLKRPGGVTLKELSKATVWQAHSVRGFLSGTIGKKMGLTVTSTKAADAERRYSVKG